MGRAPVSDEVGWEGLSEEVTSGAETERKMELLYHSER